MLKKSHIYKIQHQLQMYDLLLAEMKIINNEKQIMIHDTEFDVNIFILNENNSCITNQLSQLIKE